MALVDEAEGAKLIFRFPYVGGVLAGYCLLLFGRKASLVPEGVALNYVVLYLAALFSTERCAPLDVLKAVYSQVAGSIVFFFCYYFGTLLVALVLFLTLSSNCYNITDNIVLTASSYIASSMFMLLFYTFTKEAVGGRVLFTCFATLLFLLLEFFLVALIIVGLVMPLFLVRLALWTLGLFLRPARRLLKRRKAARKDPFHAGWDRVGS